MVIFHAYVNVSLPQGYCKCFSYSAGDMYMNKYVNN